MIDKSNFKELLKKLNFQEKNNIFIKKFDNFDCELKVDFEKEELVYPEKLKVNDKTTSNFRANENFVVFECIHRLLEIGYNPSHIEIEPKWALGHGLKSGKADIGIKDNDKNNLVIIECKTSGSEYQKALNLTKLDGGQIFSYAANSGAKYISLYASDENLNFEYFLIKLIDNNEYLENNKNLMSYKEARAGEYGDIAKALFKVWTKTYHQEGIKGLFEKDVEAYNIEKTKFSINDLKIVKEEDISKIYHKFATILRQHNVSGRENAFDKLINLFLCKVVDEKQNPDELQFYWKGFAYDEPFWFQDRLQKLYKIGMKEFLNEDITYIDNNDIDKYFAYFDINSIKIQVKKAIKELKFFTNNDFAFIDVHNEKLFYQNFEVLLKIVLLIQDIYLTNSEENQFLGDLFEGFLDQGIKQNEGQYFTPMPIVKFIISSLPKKEYANVIDYACGAGHFLNEFAKNNKTSKIVGIEKEYRLSKVAKVSSFMYQSDITIIYDDALKKDVVKDKFDLLISNPPYSVKGFLETLKEEDLKEYELIEVIDKKAYITNNSIECFFIEKVKHILNDGGIGAIIVPISILDKTNSRIFIKTREIILKYFEIKSIVKLPSNTFGKTGTTTIILYLQKRDEKKNLAFKVKDVVDDIFENKFNLLEKFEYKEFFDEFIDFMEYDKIGYMEFIQNKYNKKLFKNEIFKTYKDNFFKSLKAKDKKRGYKFLRKVFINQVKEKEKERLYFYILAKLNGKVTIILPPNKNDEIKKFLGYEWSSAKGNEGIKYISNINIDDSLDEDDKRTLANIKSINNIQTPLYNPQNIDDNTKLNKIIKDTLENKEISIDKSIEKFVNRVSLINMLDIKEVEFNKVISLSAKKEIEIKSKWELVRLGHMVDVLNGFAFKSSDYVSKSNTLNFRQANIRPDGTLDLKYKKVFLPDNFVKEYKKYLLKDGDIVIAMTDMNKELNLLAMPVIVKTNGYNLLLNQRVGKFFNFDKEKLLPNYLNLILKSDTIRNVLKNAGYGSIQTNLLKKDLLNLKIPLPPLEIQQKIVNECEKIDIEVEKAKKENEELKNKIESLFKELQTESNKNIKLSNEIFEVKIGKRVLNKEISQDENFGIPVYSANVYKPFGYIKKDLLKDFSIPSILWGIDGDWMVNTIKEKIPFYPTDHCGVLRIKSKNLIHYRYLAYILYQKGLTENFSRVKRASIEKIKKIEISYPDNYNLQKEIISKIEKFEKKIAKNKEIINNSKIKKEEILKKYL